MRKFLLVLGACTVLVGCSFSDRSLYKEKVKRYGTSWQLVLDNDKFTNTSKNYAINASIEAAGDGYTYQIVVDKPKVAMYDVEVVVVENNTSYNEDKMMPSAGIFDGSYAMIPNQVRKEKGYVGGIALNGESANDDINIKILVSWKDVTRQETKKEFFEFDLKTQQPDPTPDPTPEVPETESDGE